MVKIVDFDNEATIGTPAVDIIRVLMLQSRNNVFEALEFCNKQEFNNIEPDYGVLKARLVTWFFELQSYLEDRGMEKKEFENLYKELTSGDLDKERMMKIICFFNNKLDKLNLTKLDIRKKYDKTKWEDENKEHGI